MAAQLKHLTLTRPLAVLDVETTGTDPQEDRIVEIAVLKFAPGAPILRFARRIHPGRPIPPEATAVHGITDAGVAGLPRFRAVAPRLDRFLAGCDLAGFNLRRFDLPCLVAEFARAGRSFPIAGRAVLDVMQIFHRAEPRDLAAAVAFYLGRAHDGAHGALAAAAVLDAQVARYPDLPGDIDALHELLTDVDIGGRFRTRGNRTVFAFGKYAGRPLDEVARSDPGYLRWALDRDFLDDARALIARALELARR